MTLESGPPGARLSLPPDSLVARMSMLYPGSIEGITRRE
jgi:hypothetical protein